MHAWYRGQRNFVLLDSAMLRNKKEDGRPLVMYMASFVDDDLRNGRFYTTIALYKYFISKLLIAVNTVYCTTATAESMLSLPYTWCFDNSNSQPTGQIISLITRKALLHQIWLFAVGSTLISQLPLEFWRCSTSKTCDTMTTGQCTLYEVLLYDIPAINTGYGCKTRLWLLSVLPTWNNSKIGRASCRERV